MSSGRVTHPSRVESRSQYVTSFVWLPRDRRYCAAPSGLAPNGRLRHVTSPLYFVARASDYFFAGGFSQLGDFGFGFIQFRLQIGGQSLGFVNCVWSATMSVLALFDCVCATAVWALAFSASP